MRSGFSFLANSTPIRPFSAGSALNFSSRRTVVRLRRISGSSSITRIFLMIISVHRLAYRTGDWPKHWQPHGHGCAFIQVAFHLDTSTMQIDAPLHNHQTESSTRAVTNVMATMKGIKNPFLVGFRNTDPSVADRTNDLSLVIFYVEPDYPADVGILHCIRQQISENVPQQTFIGFDLGRNLGKAQFNRTSSLSCRQYFVKQPLREYREVQRNWFKFHLAGIEASD